MMSVENLDAIEKKINKKQKTTKQKKKIHAKTLAVPDESQMKFGVFSETPHPPYSHLE